MKYYEKCSKCERTLENTDGCVLITYYLIGGKPVCKECAKKMTGRCPVCGEYENWCGHKKNNI